MSWQGNECYVMPFDGEKYEQSMFWYLGDVLAAAREHGSGWYGCCYSNMPRADEEEWRLDSPEDYHESVIHSGIFPAFVWLDGSYASYSKLAFEAWDHDCDMLAFAGDGESPFEHVMLTGHDGEEFYANMAA